ncbi:MAG TPA: glycosyltransferase family 2 protein [Trueperaceae bacterium]|nr:glycosyltransferase family 2 protein [Trueperaceae bacterium]
MEPLMEPTTPRRPRVTIGMPTYNRRDGYFPRALASALAQDYPRLEVLVCDNASTDGTAEYIASLDDERLRYLRHELNIGANANFNSCLENATGDYFLLLHDDDLIDPTFVSRCLAALGDGPDVGLVRTGSRVIGADGEVLAVNRTNTAGLDGAEVMLRWFRRETPLYLASTLYNTRWLREIGGFNSPHGLYQDVKATAMLMARHGHHDVAEVLASFRRHDDNRGSSVKAVQWAEDAVHLLDVIEREFPVRKNELTEIGNAYLCQKCYRVASAITDPVERWRTYRQVNEMFDGAASPLVYEVRRYWRLLKGGLRGQVKAVVGRDAVAP